MSKLPFDFYEPKSDPKYTITGPNCQILTICVDPGEKIECESGTMMFMSDFLSSSVQCSSLGAVCAGEGCCRSTFTNNSEDRSKGVLALTPNYPAKVIPVDMSKVAGGTLYAQAGSYMAHFGDVQLSSSTSCNCCTACCGGMGFIKQEVKGKGTVFLNAGGTIVVKELQANEKILVDTTAVVAYAKTVDLSLRAAGGCCTICCGGEGLFNSELKGPGLVYLQSMPFQKYQLSVAPILGIPAEQVS